MVKNIDKINPRNRKRVASRMLRNHVTIVLIRRFCDIKFAPHKLPSYEKARSALPESHSRHAIYALSRCGKARSAVRKRLFRMSGRAFRRAVMCSSVRRKRLFRIFPGKLRGCRCCYMRFSFMFFRLPVSVSRISFVKIKSNRNCINMHAGI